MSMSLLPVPLFLSIIILGTDPAAAAAEEDDDDDDDDAIRVSFVFAESVSERLSVLLLLYL